MIHVVQYFHYLNNILILDTYILLYIVKYIIDIDIDRYC